MRVYLVYLHHPWSKGTTSFPFHWQGFLCTYGKNCYSVKVTNLTLMARHPKHRGSQHTLTAKWRKIGNAHTMKKIQLMKSHKISSLGPVFWSRRKQNNIRIFMWFLAHAQGKIFPVMVLADFYLRQRSCNAGIVIVCSLQFNLVSSNEFFKVLMAKIIVSMSTIDYILAMRKPMMRPPDLPKVPKIKLVYHRCII